MGRVGYIRVSSIDQNLDRQLDDQKLDKTFKDKLSGGNRNRPGLERCLEYLRDGDVLIIHSIDRLARDLRDLQDIVEQVIASGASVQFIKEGLTFSNDQSNPMSRFQLQLMGAFAEFERAIIRERQREGIAIAKKKGVQFGRRAALNENDGERVLEMLQSGVSKSEIARRLNVCRQTIYKHLKGRGENDNIHS